MRPTFPLRVAGFGAALAVLGPLAACAVPGAPGPDAGEGLRGPVTTWTGGLHCAQGFGDARGTLTLGGGTGRVEAILAYEVTEPSTQVPPGHLRMAGSVGADGAVALRGTRWIDGPEGRDLFGLTGTLDARRGTLTGTLPECGEGSILYLERVAGPQ